MGVVYPENVSQLVGPQWTLGEWMFVVWASVLTVVVCLMFVWWMAVQLFDPEDFEDLPAGGD